MKRKTKTFWAYLAGIIDGEGCLRLGKHTVNGGKTYSYGSFIIIGNTDINLINFLLDHLGGHASPIKSSKKQNKKGGWDWRPKADDVTAILTRILPFLLVKSRQAELLLLYRQTVCKPGKRTTTALLLLRDKWFNEMKKLNKRGLR